MKNKFIEINKSPKVALVTGGSRGIGRAIAIKLAENGFDIAITYHNNRQAAEEVVQQIKAIGQKCHPFQLDYQNVSSFNQKVRQIVLELRRIDVLVNNAGVLQQKPFENISADDFDKTLDTDLKGVFFLSQKVIPHLAKTKGCIINISSIGGQTGGTRAPHYAAAKAGIISLTRSLSNLYAPVGVRVNAIAPGHIATDMTSKIFKSPAYKAGIKKLIPIGRVGNVEDVANAVKFLASDDASYITGQTINVNGGMYLG